MPVSIKTPQQLAPTPPPTPPVITTGSIPVMTVNVAITPVQLAVSGGVAPFTWGPATPIPGLTLSAAGLLSGTPSALGTTTVTFTVVDALSQPALRSLSLIVNAVTGALTITVNSMPSAIAGQVQAYFAPFFAEGGLPPYTWSAVSSQSATTADGSLFPTAACFMNKVGLITSGGGVPSAGTYTVTVTVTDSAGTSVSTPAMTFTVQAVTGWTITNPPPNLPDAMLGTPYSRRACGERPRGITYTTVPGGVSGTTVTGTVTQGPAWLGFVVNSLNPQLQLDGTPDAIGSFPVSVSITGLSQTTTASFNLNVLPPAAPAFSPHYVQAGAVTSASIQVGWWPPRDIGCLSYNVYRRGPTDATPQFAGNVAVPEWPSGFPLNSQPQWRYVDVNVTPNTTYSYQIAGVNVDPRTTPPTIFEGPLSPPVNITSLGGQVSVANPPDLPISAVEPATWVAPLAVPQGGTTWTATVTAWSGTANQGQNQPGTGPNNATDCGFQYALNNAVPGDVILLTAGATYITGGSTPYVVPRGRYDGGGSGKFVYVMTTAAPELGTGGQLPVYSETTVAGTAAPYVVPVSFTAAPAASDVSATLAPNQPGLTDASGNWLKRTGKFCTYLFGTASIVDNQNWPIVYTQGSATVTWTMPLPGPVEALGRVALHNAPTITDKPVMATIEGGGATAGCLRIPTNVSYMRFIGINFAGMTGYASTAQTSLVVMPNNVLSPRPDHIYFDRCMGGSDTDLITAAGSLGGWGRSGQPPAPAGMQWSSMVRWILSNCDHLLVHQSSGLGCFDSAASNQDCMIVGGGGGGPVCFRDSYFEGSTEGVIIGGIPIDRDAVPHDYCVERMTFSKPTTWAYNFVGWKVKNHYEHKVGDRIIFRNNLLLQVWNGIVGGPQGGVNAAWSARDQNASSNTVYMNTCPWNVIADIRMYNNHILNGSHMFGITAGTDYNGMVHSGRLHVHNNLNYMKGFGQWMTTGGGVTPPTQQRTWHNFIVGAMTDMTVQNNTYIYDLPDTVNVNPAWAMPGYATAFAIDGRIGQLADRCLIADNLIDMASSNPDPARRVQLFYNTNSTNAISSGAGFTRCFTNSLFTNNLMTYLPLAAENPYWDATINFPNVPRASVGFVNLTDSLRPPVQLSDWNLAPSSPYIAASTSGGPLGATLP